MFALSLLPCVWLRSPSQRVIDAIASENSVLMEVKSQRGPLVTATGLYSMVDSIAQILGGQVALGQWVASNLTPAMKVIAYNPVIRCA